MGETEGNISLIDHLVFVSLCTLVIVGEHIQHKKNLVLKIQQCVKTNLHNADLVITENQVKHCF